MTYSKSQYNPAIHHRRSIRLKGYDYSSPGYYFATFCTQYRYYLFGKIIGGQMQLNDAGKMVEYQWVMLPERFDNIRIDQYMVMPNHFHAILQIVAPKGDVLGDILGAFTSIVTVEYIRGVKENNWQPFPKKLWQRNYWEHIIRNEEELLRIRNYIKNNPLKWEIDRFKRASANRVQENMESYEEEPWMI